MKCPAATQDPALNRLNKQRTKQQFGYGPDDLNKQNAAFWKAKARAFELPVVLAKLRRCGNCGVFDVSDQMVACGGASYEGDVGFCRGHQFKCSAMRVCDTWSPGGPVTDG